MRVTKRVEAHIREQISKELGCTHSAKFEELQKLALDVKKEVDDKVRVFQEKTRA